MLVTPLVVVIAEAWSFWTHIFFYPSFEVLLSDLDEFGVLFVIWVIIFEVSTMLHICRFFNGDFVFVTIGSWGLIDHITAQGGVVQTSILFMGFKNRVLRDSFIILANALLALLLIIHDVYYFTIGLTALFLAIGAYRNFRIWKSVVKTVDFFLALVVAGFAFSMYFVVDGPGIAHGFWHAGVAIDLWLWLRIYVMHFKNPAAAPVESSPPKKQKKPVSIARETLGSRARRFVDEKKQMFRRSGGKRF